MKQSAQAQLVERGEHRMTQVLQVDSGCTLYPVPMHLGLLFFPGLTAEPHVYF